MPAEAQDFIKGWPHPSLLQGEETRKDLMDSFKHGIELSAESLNYGTAKDGAFMLGHPAFLKALAEFLERQYEKPVSPKNLMSTAGGSMATDICVRVHGKPGDICIVEEPTYFLAFTMIRDHGMSLLGVPMEDDGLDLAAVEKHCIEQKGKVKMLYTVPIHHNPSGICMSNEKRTKLLALAKKYDFKIVADEAYQILNFEKNDFKPLFYHDDPADPRVFSIGTFSKLIGPGVKVGWVQAHEALIKPLPSIGYIDSGNNPVIFSSCNLIHFLESGNCEKHIKMVSAALGKKCKVLCEKLREVGLEPRDPKGGYFVWVQSKGKMTGKAGTPMTLNKDKFHDYMRLCFGYLDEAQITEGIEYLRQ
jgi:DNA-binding transcriptional MocR family regulator